MRPVIMALRMATVVVAVAAAAAVVVVVAATEQLNHLQMAARKRDSREREGFVVAGWIPVPSDWVCLSALK